MIPFGINSVIMKHVDIIIVGQGIAGSILAYQLIKKGKSLLIVDSDNANSSKIAAGLITPITGRRYVKSWLFDQLNGFLIPFYKHLEKEFGNLIYHEISICKIIVSSVEDCRFFMA